VSEFLSEVFEGIHLSMRNMYIPLSLNQSCIVLHLLGGAQKSKPLELGSCCDSFVSGAVAVAERTVSKRWRIWPRSSHLDLWVTWIQEFVLFLTWGRIDFQALSFVLSTVGYSRSQML